MMKRILSIALVALMLVATATVSFSASAAEETAVATGANFIKFNAKGWNNVKAVYAHVWVNSGKSFYAWGKTEDTICENIQGTMWQYDLSKLNKSADIPGGIKSGVDYCIIFHADTGVQTYDLTFGAECIGDTAKMTGKMVENPVDSEKQGYEAVWSKNSSKYGPHRAITSIGNFIGSKLCPNEEPVRILGDWILTYPATSLHCKPEEVLAKAMKEFKVKDIDTVYAYAEMKIENGEGGLAEADKVKDYLEKAYKIAYGQEATVDTQKVENKKKQLEDGKDTREVSEDENTNTSTGTSTGTGTATGTTSTNNSGSGADGESDVILFVLAGLMLLAAGAFVATRRRED